jgi:hypothetical protein
MKKYLVPIIVLLIPLITIAQTGPEITSWLQNTTSTGYGGIVSNCQLVQYSATEVYVSCTCIPGYSVGPWTGNPNVPSNQNFVFKITRNPLQNTGTATAIGLGHIGIWANGVSIFNVSDAMSYNNQGVWNRNAYYWEGPGFDNCLGHPQQQGEYHHHVSPKCLFNETDSIHHSPIIGYAFDGFPVYGPYAYTNVNGTGPIKRMTSSYQLRNMTIRDTLPNGSLAGSAGPNPSSSYPLGCFIEDYKFITSSGDLDTRNGRFCITPEYPGGTYAYFVTVDAALNPVFPYTFYGTYYGLVQSGNMGPGSGHITISESTTIYTTSSGIDEKNVPIKFQLMPNPTEDYVYIYFDPASANNVKASIYNTNGQLMQEVQNMQPSIAYTFDLTKLARGMYFLHLETQTQKVIQKIVKTK